MKKISKGLFMTFIGSMIVLSAFVFMDDTPSYAQKNTESKAIFYVQ